MTVRSRPIYIGSALLERIEEELYRRAVDMTESATYDAGSPALALHHDRSEANIKKWLTWAEAEERSDLVDAIEVWVETNQKLHKPQRKKRT